MKRARQDEDEEACICDVVAVTRIRHHSCRVQEELRAQLPAAEINAETFVHDDQGHGSETGLHQRNCERSSTRHATTAAPLDTPPSAELEAESVPSSLPSSVTQPHFEDRRR